MHEINQESAGVPVESSVEYIGDREIKSFEAISGGNAVQVEFADGYKTKMSGTLFFHLKRNEKGVGSVTDQVNHYFAKKFIAELSQEGLEYYFVENIGMAMRTLIHNLREEAIRAKFECSGADAIAISKLIPE